MGPEAIDALVHAAIGYCGCGGIFWIAFVAQLARRLDPDARDATLGFKFLILPGVVVLWPILLRRLLAGGEPASAAQPWGARWRRWHGYSALALAVGLPTAFAWALAGREPVPLSATLPVDPRFRPSAEPLPIGAGQLFALQVSDTRWQARCTGDRLAVVQLEGEPRPDVLAYWAQSTTGTALDELPQDARLLGPVAREERTWHRPTRDGTLLLFDLAHGEVVVQLSLSEQAEEAR